MGALSGGGADYEAHGAAMNLFIDTNIFLDFYHLSGADIAELHKLTELLKSGDLKLFITDQLSDEFKRNRDNKIKDAMNAFNKPKLSINFPAFWKLYPEYTELKSMLEEATQNTLISIRKQWMT